MTNIAVLQFCREHLISIEPEDNLVLGAPVVSLKLRIFCTISRHHPTQNKDDDHQHRAQLSYSPKFLVSSLYWSGVL